MAPVWMAMSKTLAFSPMKSSSDAVRIRWPVEEMGRNSVSPSTTPMIAALPSSRMSNVRCLSAAALPVQSGA